MFFKKTSPTNAYFDSETKTKNCSCRHRRITGKFENGLVLDDVRQLLHLFNVILYDGYE